MLCMMQVSQSIQINASSEEVFNFHANLNNIAKVIPSFIKVNIEQIEWPFEKDAEAILSFKLWNLIFLFEWKLKLIEYEKPNYFTDLALNGFFKHFSHKHEFVSNGSDKAILQDTINYEFVPWLDKSLVKWVLKLFLKQKLEQTKQIIEKLS